MMPGRSIASVSLELRRTGHTTHHIATLTRAHQLLNENPKRGLPSVITDDDASGSFSAQQSLTQSARVLDSWSEMGRTPVRCTSLVQNQLCREQAYTIRELGVETRQTPLRPFITGMRLE